MKIQEIIESGNKNRTTWAIYAQNKYVGKINDKRNPTEIAEEICKGARRKNYKIKIGAIIIL